MNTSDGKTRQRVARRGLAVYLGVLTVLTAIAETKLISYHEPTEHHPGLVYLLMVSPTAASVIARLALREGIRDVSFRFGGKQGVRAMLTAWLFPIGVGFIAYGLAWGTHLARFQPPITPDMNAPYSPDPFVNFSTSLAFMATAGTLLNCASAIGEELGWRGYMLTRLIDADIPHPVLVSGLMWGTWHLPLIASGIYASSAHPLVSMALFMVAINAAGYFAAYVRLRSGSIWPAVLFHGAWNAVIVGTFNSATAGQPTAVGESGWLVALVSIMVVAWIIRGIWPKLRWPGKPMSVMTGEVHVDARSARISPAGSPS